MALAKAPGTPHLSINTERVNAPQPPARFVKAPPLSPEAEPFFFSGLRHLSKNAPARTA
jgi:hypothetical protein